MKNELAVFENRSDDWLAKQRKEENKISVWDFDEAKKIKIEHEKIHKEYLNKQQTTNSVKKNQSRFKQDFKAKLIMEIMSLLFIAFILQMLGFNIF